MVYRYAVKSIFHSTLKNLKTYFPSASSAEALIHSFELFFKEPVNQLYNPNNDCHDRSLI